MANLIGQSLGRYHILEQLGEGGMASVYKAFDTRLEREVAIKIIRREAFPPQHLAHILKRFEREAKVLASLTHPNIVKVLDSGEQGGMPYLVMEFIPSGTLKELLKQSPNPIHWKTAAQLLAPIAYALQHAHQHKDRIIHRDVKPSNILITKNSMPMLSDFGIAKLLESEETIELTATGVGIGTAEYMAPEQAMSKSVDHRADIYALGTVFYEMITGRKPYQADTPLAVMIKKSTEPLPRPTKFVPDLPESIERILFKALAKNPEDRYSDMSIFADTLDKLTQSTIPKVELPRTIPKPIVVNSREFKLAVGLTVTAIICVAGIATLWIGSNKLNQFFSQNKTQTPITENPIEASPVLETPTSIPAPLPPTELVINNAEMVYIPQGEFIMGGWAKDAFEECQKLFIGNTCLKERFVNEEPEHKIYLDAFFIDKFEVSNSNYRDCVNGGKCQPPTTPGSYTRPKYYLNDTYDNYPVVNVNWSMADIYCKWRGARLPTEAEWEKAARGENGNIYPWGNTFNGSKTNFCDASCPSEFTWINQNFSDGYSETAPVDSFQNGTSVYDVYNMAGNVWEWVNDRYEDRYYANSPSSNPAGPDSGDRRVLRGGSWVDPGHYVRVTYRVGLASSYINTYVGFRCAVDAP